MSSSLADNRGEGLQIAFGLVLRALRDSYPQLRRVPPSQLAQSMQGLVDKREMEADIAASVRQLQELLGMPEWDSDESGDTRGYAFLMLAEGAIHEILRTAQRRSASAAGAPRTPVPPVSPSWHGTYDDRFPIELHIHRWDGLQFTGIVAYPDDDTATSVSGQASDQAGNATVSLSWQEREYSRRGRRTIDFSGSYTASVTGGQMNASWGRGSQPIVRFTMTAGTTTPPFLS